MSKDLARLDVTAIEDTLCYCIPAEQVQRLEKLDLPTLANFYRIDSHDAHHALSDAFVTALIWQKMLHTLQGKGVRSLGKLLKIAGK